MQRVFVAAAVMLLIMLVMSRVIMMKERGIRAFKFAETYKSDLLILPFALFFLYLVFVGAFDWPRPGKELYSSEAVGWAGVALCAIGLVWFLLAFVSFGKSFRVGIDEQHPGKLVTSGIFAVSRNPIYTAFAFLLIGVFLAIPNWILLLYIAAGIWLFHRQVLREETALRKLYGSEYEEYCKRVRRYLQVTIPEVL